MARYIDATKLARGLAGAALRADYGDEVNRIVDIFCKIIMDEPTADVEEVKHGEWETVVVYNDTCIATCSSCRQPIVERECNATAFKLENEFCRKCGAKMDGGKSE